MISGGPLRLLGASIGICYGRAAARRRMQAFAAIAFSMRAGRAQSFSRTEFAQAIQQRLPVEASDTDGTVDVALGTPLVARRAVRANVRIHPR